MPKPFSQDLRNRVIDAVERRMSCRPAARHYEVSVVDGDPELERYRRESLRAPMGHAAIVPRP